jgi:catechol 2,3-dioxygenase-like lactoylglutathione lyase family enzyme
MVVGNTMLIPIAPLGDGLKTGSSVGDMLREHDRPGMWIGIALKVDDVQAADKWLSGMGFHPWYRPGFESIYFVLPRDETLGIRIEILKVSLPNDPRPKPDWDANWWRDHHPLGIEGLQSIGVSVDTLQQGRDFFEGKLGWPEIAQRSVPEEQCNIASFFAGDVVIEAMEPTDADSAIARHRRDCQGMYCLTFKVRSAAGAAAYLQQKGYRLVGDIVTRFAIDPDQAFSRLLYFTEQDLPNYPPVGSMIPGWEPSRSFIPDVEASS